MDAWEAYAVDAAEEQGDQPAEDAISKGLESLADSASQWLAPGVEKAAAAADGLRQKGLEAANQGLAAAKDRAKLFDLNALQANDPLFAAGEQPAAPAAEPDGLRDRVLAPGAPSPTRRPRSRSRRPPFSGSSRAAS